MSEESRRTFSLTIHPWCMSPSRDEAVRASEDGRPGPLPTLEAVIQRQQHACALACVKDGFARLDEAWGRVPKSVSASSAVEQENKGDDMGGSTWFLKSEQPAPALPFAKQAKCSPAVSVSGEGQSGMPTERVTERRPPEPGGGGNVTGGMRTERVTLEIKHFDDNDGDSVYRWNWSEMMAEQGLGINESVRVVEEPDFLDIAQVMMQRDSAIRERDEAKARVDYLERDRKFWCLQSGAHEQAANVLRARVAELESAAKLAPAANADGGSNHAAPDASGNVEKKPMKMPSRAWFERMASVDDSEMSVGGLASRVTELESSALAASGAAGTEAAG